MSNKFFFFYLWQGTDQHILIEWNLGSPGGLAIDWGTKILYWTDANTDRIEAAHLNGSNRAIIIHKDLDKPRDIVIHSDRGYVVNNTLNYFEHSLMSQPYSSCEGMVDASNWLCQASIPNGMHSFHQQIMSDTMSG